MSIGLNQLILGGGWGGGDSREDEINYIKKKIKQKSEKEAQNSSPKFKKFMIKFQKIHDQILHKNSQSVS